MSQLVRKERKPPQRLPPLNAADEMLAAIAQSHLSLEEISTSPAMPDKTFTVLSKQEPTLRCRFHLGTVVNKVRNISNPVTMAHQDLSCGQCWTCCDRNVLAEPCSGSWEHVPRIHDLKHSDIRPAVAIDCEMGTALSGDSELIRVSMIDYFSGATLLDNIVEPDVPMRHLNTRFSGVSWADVNRARRQKTCLQGKAGARWAIWRYVGPTTLVIGHSVSNDLRALNWLMRMWLIRS
jgi:RNA exonuclease 1